MRRILENYFCFLGGNWDSGLGERFEGEDLAVLNAFISWVHRGSHRVFDGLEIGGAARTRRDASSKVFDLDRGATFLNAQEEQGCLVVEDRREARSASKGAMRAATSL